MTLDQLQVIETIVKKGSFRAASEALNRAQSAVSYAVKSLEEEWQVEIFDRSSYRPKLTKNGESLLVRAQRVLSEAQDLDSLAKSLKTGIEAELRLAISILFPIQNLLPALQTVRREFPQTRVTLDLDIFTGDQRVLDDEVDCAITHTSSSELEATLITHIEMIRVCSSDHPLSKMSPENVISGLTRYSQIIVNHHSTNREAGIIKSTNRWNAPDFETKKELIVSGFGWGGMPRYKIDQELHSGDLVALAGQEPIQVPLHFVRKRSRALGPVAEVFFKRLQDTPEKI